MKKVIICFFMCMSFLSASGTNETEGEKCYYCSTASKEKCNQCSMGSKDTPEARKKCEKAGCKVVGTGNCSTAAKTKTCG